MIVNIHPSEQFENKQIDAVRSGRKDVCNSGPDPAPACLSRTTRFGPAAARAAPFDRDGQNGMVEGNGIRRKRYVTRKASR
jgi:hypothetical protein